MVHTAIFYDSLAVCILLTINLCLLCNTLNHILTDKTGGLGDKANGRHAELPIPNMCYDVTECDVRCRYIHVCPCI